tara:strand:+ start:6008 stop:7501 length:1494 start_codon:yes stop_codon:yes gene_type:complete
MRVIYTLILAIFFIVSCNNEDDIIGGGNSGSLSFSVDTLLFDTVFTTVGSATRYLKVYNNSNSDINLENVYLNGGETSPFRINVDGESGTVVNDILIRAKDSLYVFADVNINPNDGLNSYFIEQDKIIFDYDNTNQNVDLTAWGIDAYFYPGISDHQSEFQYVDSIDFDGDGIFEYKFFNINTSSFWNNDKPHVIYGDLWVTNGATLNIGAGSNIYLHNNSNIIVTESSSLIMNGGQSNDQLITVQGDRLESYYQNIPGQWGKIWLTAGSINNKIEYTIIQNGTIGIQIDSTVNENPSLELKNTIINNMSGLGILAQDSHVIGENLLVTNCGQFGLALNFGGKYDFKHCTFANYYSTLSRQTPNIFLNNYYEDINGTIQNRNLEQANFSNCIIYGDNENELLLDNNNESLFNYNFDHCLVKIDTTIYNPLNDPNFNQCLINSDPRFIDVDIWNFELDSISPAINIGSETTANLVPYDINGNYRVLLPDLGCFEMVNY